LHWIKKKSVLNARYLVMPVCNADGKIIAALWTLTILQPDKSSLPKVVELAKDAAQKVTRQIGYSDGKRDDF